MIEIDIRPDIRAARGFLKEVEGKAYRKATARAINDTARTVRKEGAQRIRAHHKALKIGDIKRNIDWRKAYERRLWSTLRVRGRPLSLKLFRPHELKRGGVKVTLGTQRINITYKGRKAFRVKRYDNEIFVRKFATGRQIRRLRGPSLPGVFRARTLEFKRIVAERFPKTFRSRMQFEIDKAARRARARSKAQQAGLTTSQFRALAQALRPS